MNVNVLIAFYSRTGSTEALAKSIAEGAASAGATVRLRRARELVSPEVMESVPGWPAAAERMNAAYDAPTEDDAEWADAIIFGTPTRFGSVSSELRRISTVWEVCGFAAGSMAKSARYSPQAPHRMAATNRP